MWQDKIGNCSLHDYDFGEDLKKKYNIESDVATSSKSECSKKCDQDEICTFSSWNANERKCLTLNGLKDGQWKRDNPPYFCKENGSIITEKEVLCKPASQVVHESHGKYWFFINYLIKQSRITTINIVLNISSTAMEVWSKSQEVTKSNWQLEVWNKRGLP